LPYAEAVFSIDYFRRNPNPFYELASEIHPSNFRFRPTPTHSFISLLNSKGILLREFTQIIDVLSRAAGVPPSLIVEAHGSFASQSCIDCKNSYPDDAMRLAVESKKIPYCKAKGCNGLVKPEIVFFGEQLPAAFFANRTVPAQADLCTVMGTSLTVQPFASLPDSVPKNVPRLLINMEHVGSFGTRPDDVILLGDCDFGVRKLSEACGWLEELEEMWDATGARFNVKSKWKDSGSSSKKSEDRKLEEEIESLTREIDETLTLAGTHEDELRGEFDLKGMTKIERSITKDEPSVNLPAPLATTTGIDKAGDEAASKEQILGSPNIQVLEEGGLPHVFPHLTGAIGKTKSVIDWEN